MKYIKNIAKFLLLGGYQAIILYRIAHWFHTKNLEIIALIITRFSIIINSIEISPSAELGHSVSFTHPLGVVIGGGVIIGNNVIIRQNVTLGQKGNNQNEKLDNTIHPTIEDGVIIGAGACVLGGITIGKNSIIGANAVVMKNIPAESVVVGVPGNIIKK